jgi:acetyltransferase-like isoleucine patch superfamily enzyme
MANYFHETAKIGKNVSIEVSSRGTNTYIGEQSVIDDFVKIKHVGGTGHIRIGNYVYINSGTVIYSGNGVEIGDNVLIGPNCNIVPVNHNVSNPNELIRLQGFSPSKGGARINSNVWLGAAVTILDGSLIHEGVVVAANSLVNGELEANWIYAGVPAKKIKRR